jgi:hypothetical protein
MTNGVEEYMKEMITILGLPLGDQVDGITGRTS